MNLSMHYILLIIPTILFYYLIYLQSLDTISTCVVFFLDF